LDWWRGGDAGGWGSFHGNGLRGEECVGGDSSSGQGINESPDRESGGDPLRGPRVVKGRVDSIIVKGEINQYGGPEIVEKPNVHYDEKRIRGKTNIIHGKKSYGSGPG